MSVLLFAVVLVLAVVVLVALKIVVVSAIVSASVVVAEKTILVLHVISNSVLNERSQRKILEQQSHLPSGDQVPSPRIEPICLRTSLLQSSYP